MREKEESRYHDADAEAMQNTRCMALKMVAELHPVAACHVIAALCRTITEVLLGLRGGIGVHVGGNAVQNSILCLRALDSSSTILRAQHQWTSSVGLDAWLEKSAGIDNGPKTKRAADCHLTLGEETWLAASKCWRQAFSCLSEAGGEVAHRHALLSYATLEVCGRMLAARPSGLQSLSVQELLLPHEGT